LTLEFESLMPIEMPILYLISDNDFTTIALPFSLLES